jgi:hypothetical protein
MITWPWCVVPHITQSDNRPRLLDDTINVKTYNAVLSDVMPRGSCKNRRVGGNRLRHQGDTTRQTRKNVSTNYQPKHAA